jgi:F0F1-type ATP synthase membrane subunit a
LLPEAILVLHLLLNPLEIVEVFFGTLVLSLRLFALLLVLVFEVGYLLFPLEIVALQDLKLLGLVF